MGEEDRKAKKRKRVAPGPNDPLKKPKHVKIVEPKPLPPSTHPQPPTKEGPQKAPGGHSQRQGALGGSDEKGKGKAREASGVPVAPDPVVQGPPRGDKGLSKAEKKQVKQEKRRTTTPATQTSATVKVCRLSCDFAPRCQRSEGEMGLTWRFRRGVLVLGGCTRCPSRCRPPSWTTRSRRN
jgi:hypothetical protein